jgi:hypothetical protein
MAFITARKDLYVITKMGHSFRVTAKTPKEVPDIVLDAALEAGCVECDAVGNLILRDDVQETETAAAPLEPNEALLAEVPVLSAEDRQDEEKRRDAVVAAIKYLLEVGDPKDFRKDNTPKAASLARVLGFDVTVSELLQAFTIVQKE